MTTAAAKTGRRRWPWWVGGIATALVLPVVTVFVMLATAADRAVVARELLGLANHEFSGRIDLERAWLFPNGHFMARGVTIRGADGELIIRAATVETHVDLGALAKKRLHLTHTEVGGAELYLATDGQGRVNIVEAFRPRPSAPSTGAARAKGPGFVVELDGADARVDEARLTLGAAGPSPTVLAELRRVALHGSFLLDPAGVITVGVPMLQADALAPLADPLQLAETTVRLAGSELQLGSDATFDDAELKANATLDVDTLSGVATLTEGRVGPRFLARWLADLEPQGLRGSASVALQAGQVELVSMRINPLRGKGELSGTGRLDLVRGDGEAHLIAKDLDARALFGRMPASRLALKLEASAERLFQPPRRLTGHVAIGQSSIEGKSVGPGEATASLAGGTLAFSDVDVAFPGGRIQGAARLSKARVAGHAEIAATDLASLRTSLAGMFGVHVPRFAGQLSSEVEVDGAPSALGLRATVHAPRLSLNGLEAEGVEAKLDAPRLGRSMELQGQATLGQLNVVSHSLRDIGVSIAWTTPKLHLEVQAQERGKAIDLTADLLLPSDLESATVSAFLLHAAGSDWVMAQPATLDFHDGFALNELELRSPPQRLRLSLNAAAHSLNATVQLEALDLAALPATLLPTLNLAGRVEGLARYQDRAGRRSGDADLSLSEITFRGLKIASGRVKGALDGQHVSVDLAARLGHGDLTLVGAGPIPGVAGPLDAKLAARGIVLDDFAGLVSQLAGTHAALSLALDLGGDWAAPQLVLTASAGGVTGAWTRDPEAGVLAAPLAATLHLKLDPKGLQDDLSVVAGPASLLSLVGTAPIPSRKLAELFEAPGKLWTEILAAPIDEGLMLSELPIEVVMHRLPWPRAPEVAGTLSAQGHLHGSLRAPRGELSLSTRTLTYEHHSLGALALQMAATDRGFNARVDLRPPRGQATATVEWLLAPEKLVDSKLRQSARLTADVALSGLPLATALGDQAALQGFIDLSASFRGSLAEPAAKAKLGLDGVTLQKVPMGTLDVQAAWNGTHLTGSLGGRQPQGGHLEGRADLPLTVQGGPRSQPLTAALTATGFDLGPFGALAVWSGVARGIGGRLDSQLKLSGTLAAPEPSGTLSLSRGRLALAGLGQFDDLEAHATLAADGIDACKVTGKSASGTILVSGSARHGSAPGMAVQAHLETERLGVFASDQLVGYLSSSEELAGSVGRENTDLTLTVHHALLALPNLVPRGSGPTAIDADIVVGDEPRAAVHEGKAYPFRLDVVAPEGLELKATDLDIQARAALVLEVAGQAQIKGGVFATGGVVNAYGRRFKLEHANVVFGDADSFGPAGNPYIDAQASQSIGKYRLFIDVAGHLADLRIVSSSEPPLDKEQVGQLLVTGNADGIAGGASGGPALGGSLAAASALGGVVSERLRDWLGPYMPLDVLTVNPSHLEAGKHLTDRLYVGAVENLGVTDPRVNGTEVHANYKLTDRWALDSRYGTAQAGSLDLQWVRSW